MVTIAYFISDHGFGHAARSIAIIRALLVCDLEISINIHTSRPLQFVQRSLSPFQRSKRVDFHEQLNDFGFIKAGDSNNIDYQQTAIAVHDWIQKWGSSYIFDEYSYLKKKNVDMIVSDIAPQPFILAKKLNIPSIAISNFTWFDIYNNPAFQLEDLETIWKAYREASLGLMLPFNLENTVFQTIIETNLVSRNPTRSKKEIYDFFEIDSSSCVIYAGTGMSQDNPFLKEWSKHSDFTFILGSKSKLSSNNIKKVPVLDSEAQDFIAASDIAVIKIGYSSLSEAIRSQVPIIGIDFAQTVESVVMSQKLQELNIGLCIKPEEYFCGKWFEYLPEVLKMKKNYSSLPERFVKKGEYQITDIILELLEENI